MGGLTVALASAPGCLNRLTGGSGSSGPVPNDDYSEWLPAPDVVPRGEYAFFSMAPRRIREIADEAGLEEVRELERARSIPGIDSVSQIRAMHLAGAQRPIVEGDFEADPVVDALVDAGFSDVGTYRGRQVFTTRGQRAAAVADGELVVASPFSSEDDADKRAVVETLLDVNAGEAARYVDAVSDCERLVEGIGDCHLLKGRTHDGEYSVDGAVGDGIGVDMSADESEIRASVVFADGAVEPAAVTDWTERSPAFRDVEFDASTDGRVVTATATTRPTDETVSGLPFPGSDVE